MIDGLMCPLLPFFDTFCKNIYVRFASRYTILPSKIASLRPIARNATLIVSFGLSSDEEINQPGHRRPLSEFKTDKKKGCVSVLIV